MIPRSLFAAALFVALAGCGSSTMSPIASAPTMSAPIVPASAALRLRFVNGSPGTGNIDVYLYLHGTLRPSLPTFANVPFGGITPFVPELGAQYDVDVLRAGAVPVEAAIAHATNVVIFVVLDSGQTNSMAGSLVISGTNLSGTRAIQYFQEPFEPAGHSALVVHHASPAANALAALGAIGIGAYSTTTYPPGTVASAIAPRATVKIFGLTFAQNPQAVPHPNSIAADGSMLFVTPFPVAPFPADVGFAVGLPNKSMAVHAPLASVLANAALSETANENSPFANQNELTNDTAETVGAGTHISEFLIDADQNGNVGLIGSVDP